jgi:hypothetical protein
VTLRLRDGRHFVRVVETAPGSPLRPLTAAEVADKYRACATRAGIGEGEIATSLASWLDVASVDDIRPAIDSLIVNDSVLI